MQGRSRIRDRAGISLYAARKAPIIYMVPLMVLRMRPPSVGASFLADTAVPTDDDKRDSTATRTQRTPTVRGEESRAVITVTRLDGNELVVNAELIELVEATPDTHLTLLDGRKLIVQEDPTEIVARVIAYRRAAYGPMRAIQIAS